MPPGDTNWRGRGRGFISCFPWSAHCDTYRSVRLFPNHESNLHFGPRLGIERCGKINASNSGSESCTGIGVVTGFGAVVLMIEWPHMKQGDAHWKITLLHILQEVRTIYKTRNQLIGWGAYTSYKVAILR